MFRLLSFAKLSRKNRAAKNLRRSCAIAKSQHQRGSALIIAQNCAAKNSRRNGAIAKPKINKGQQPLPCSRKCATHAKYVQQHNMCTIRRPTPIRPFKQKLQRGTESALPRPYQSEKARPA